MRIRPAAAHLFVGADAHIGPTECTIFTKIFGEFAASQRADVGIGPYNGYGSAQGFALNKGKPWGRISRHIQLVEIFISVFRDMLLAAL